MKPLIAVEYYEDQGGTDFINPTIINNYQEAIEYQKKSDEKGVNPVEFLLFPDDMDVLSIVEEIYLHYYDKLEYYDLDEVQKHFGIDIPTYNDGTEICVGDKFTIPANTFIWGYVFDNNEQYTGTVTNISSSFLVEVILDKQKSRSRWEIQHYNLSKVNE